MLMAGFLQSESRHLRIAEWLQNVQKSASAPSSDRDKYVDNPKRKRDSFDLDNMATTPPPTDSSLRTEQGDSTAIPTSVRKKRRVDDAEAPDPEKTPLASSMRSISLRRPVLSLPRSHARTASPIRSVASLAQL